MAARPTRTRRFVVRALPAVAVLSATVFAAAVLGAAPALAAPASWIYYLVHPAPLAGALRCNSTSIWRVRPDGTSPQEVLPGAYVDFVFPDDNGASQTDGEYSVSSDGGYIVRVLAAPTPLGHTDEAHLYLYDLKEGTVRQLTFGHAADRWPAISANDQTVAFTRTTYRAPEVFGAGAETTVTEIVPLSSGTPQVVPKRPGDATLDRQISWVSNSTFEKEGAGAVTVNLATGHTTQWLRPTSAYDPLVFSSRRTPFGILYTSSTLTINGSLKHRPVAGLYLATHPVNVTGRLLRRYKWSIALPPANGLYSLQVLPGTRTLVAQQHGRLVTGPLDGCAAHARRAERHGRAPRDRVRSRNAPGTDTDARCGRRPGLCLTPRRLLAGWPLACSQDPVREQQDTREGRSPRAVQRLPDIGRKRRQRQRAQVAVVDVFLGDEEQMLPRRVVALVRRAARHADAAAQRLVGGQRVGFGDLPGAAYEHHHGPDTELLVAARLRPPGGQERVVALELRDVVGDAVGEIELDDDIERQRVFG